MGLPSPRVLVLPVGSWDPPHSSFRKTGGACVGCLKATPGSGPSTLHFCPPSVTKNLVMGHSEQQGRLGNEVWATSQRIFGCKGDLDVVQRALCAKTRGWEFL